MGKLALPHLAHERPGTVMVAKLDHEYNEARGFRMSRFKYGDNIEPMRIERPTFAELPSVDYLARLAERVEWLLLQVPTAATVGEDEKRSDPTLAERERYIRELTALLPEHQVWDGGFLPDEASLPAARRNAVGTVITGMARFSARRVVTERSLQQNLELLTSAAAEYRTLANALMRRLAWQLKVDVAEFAAHYSWHSHKQDGWLRKHVGDADTDGEWRYFFHGVDCAFTNRTTEVTVEARLGYGSVCGEDFGVFDAGFFLWFINSNISHRPEYLPLAEMLRDWWDNARLALEFMERHSVLRRISSDAVIGRGWVFVAEKN